VGSITTTADRAGEATGLLAHAQVKASGASLQELHIERNKDTFPKRRVYSQYGLWTRSIVSVKHLSIEVGN
jgi:hypothetical protein